MSKSQEKANVKFWGENTQNFLVHASRTAVEDYSENFVLYFEVDYLKSKRNFYGEFEILQFKDENGKKIKGVVNVENSEVSESFQLLEQNTSLAFFCYIEHLKDLGIDIQVGDYFKYKNKFYYVFNVIALDANKNVIASGDEPIWQKYNCYQEDNEIIQHKQ